MFRAAVKTALFKCRFQGSNHDFEDFDYLKFSDQVLTVFVEPCLGLELAAGLGIKGGVDDRDGCLVCQLVDKKLVILGKCIQIGAFQRQNAQYLLLVDQGDCQ